MNRKYCKCIKIKSIHTTGRNCGISVIHTHRQLQICNVLYKSNRPHCNTNGRATSDSQNNYLKNFHKIHYEHLICFTFYWPCIMQWLLVNDQSDTQIPFYVFIFLFITLYTFRAHRAHHQETNFINTTSGNCYSVLVAVSCAGLQIDSYQKLYWYNLSRLVMSTVCSKRVESYK